MPKNLKRTLNKQRMNKMVGEAVKKLDNLGKKLVKDIEEEKNPSMTIPLRALSNVVFDRQYKTLRIGDKTFVRSFFNVAHARKFLQTVEVGAISKDLLNNNKHASLRDVFYMAKRTIPNTKINVVDEQQESDNAVEDLEMITGSWREQLHINANKLGAVAGNVIVEDAGDTIDWS